MQYSESIAANTFPANRHSAPCCWLDTSLLSAGQQGAERRSASKVTVVAKTEAEFDNILDWCLSPTMLTDIKAGLLIFAAKVEDPATVTKYLDRIWIV